MAQIYAMEQNEADKIIEQLEKLGYFDFADRERLINIQHVIRHNLTTNGTLDSSFAEDGKIEFLDGRTFQANEKNLQRGKCVEFLTPMLPLLRTLGVNYAKVDNKVTEEGDIFLIIENERVELFNKKLDAVYPLMEDETTGVEPYSYGGLVLSRLIDKINVDLAKQNSAQKVYSIFVGNDTRVIFLTEELKQFINSLPLDPGFHIS